ncbi:MAG: hypothetical protein ACRC2K_01420 [Clostridium sp.]
MRNIKLEKAIKKLDKEIEALKIVTKYLSNLDEIEEVRELLNKERQVLADEIYIEDQKSYYELKEYMMDFVGRDILKDEQVELLNKIKEVYGRLSPNVSKDSNGLNAWLKFMNVECSWAENPNSEWAILKITDFKLV